MQAVADCEPVPLMESGNPYYSIKMENPEPPSQKVESKHPEATDEVLDQSDFADTGCVPLAHFSLEAHTELGNLAGGTVHVIPLYAKDSGRAPRVVLSGTGTVPSFAFTPYQGSSKFERDTKKTPKPCAVLNLSDGDSQLLKHHSHQLNALVESNSVRWAQEQPNIDPESLTISPCVNVNPKRKKDGSSWPTSLKLSLNSDTQFVDTAGKTLTQADAVNRQWEQLVMSYDAVYISPDGACGFMRSLVKLVVGDHVEYSASSSLNIPARVFNVVKDVTFLEPEVMENRLTVGIRSRLDESQFVCLQFDQAGTFPLFAVAPGMTANTTKITFNISVEEHNNLLAASAAFTAKYVENGGAWIKGDAEDKSWLGMKSKISPFVTERKDSKKNDGSVYSPLFSGTVSNENAEKDGFCMDTLNRPVSLDDLRDRRFKLIEVNIPVVFTTKKTIGVSKKIKRIVVYPR